MNMIAGSSRGVRQMDYMPGSKVNLTDTILKLLEEALKVADEADLLLTAARISSAIDALNVEKPTSH
jgi:hypothetical protein